jgi:hypothetical protein
MSAYHAAALGLAWSGPCRRVRNAASGELWIRRSRFVVIVVVGAKCEVVLSLTGLSTACLLIILLIIPISFMASSSSSSSNFQSIFGASLQSYNNKTKYELLDHPLATKLQSCDSPNAVLTVLQDLIQQFDQRRTSDERLKNWLNPTVNVLYTFSSALGEGVGLVSLSSPSLCNLYSDRQLLGIPFRKSDICWYRCPSLGERPCRSLNIGDPKTDTF